MSLSAALKRLNSSAASFTLLAGRYPAWRFTKLVAGDCTELSSMSARGPKQRHRRLPKTLRYVSTVAPAHTTVPTASGTYGPTGSNVVKRARDHDTSPSNTSHFAGL